MQKTTFAYSVLADSRPSFGGSDCIMTSTIFAFHGFAQKFRRLFCQLRAVSGLRHRLPAQFLEYFVCQRFDALHFREQLHGCTSGGVADVDGGTGGTGLAVESPVFAASAATMPFMIFAMAESAPHTMADFGELSASAMTAASPEMAVAHAVMDVRQFTPRSFTIRSFIALILAPFRDRPFPRAA